MHLHGPTRLGCSSTVSQPIWLGSCLLHAHSPLSILLPWEYAPGTSRQLCASVPPLNHSLTHGIPGLSTDALSGGSVASYEAHWRSTERCVDSLPRSTPRALSTIGALAVMSDRNIWPGRLGWAKALGPCSRVVHSICGPDCLPGAVVHAFVMRRRQIFMPLSCLIC